MPNMGVSGTKGAQILVPISIHRRMIEQMNGSGVMTGEL